MFLTPRWLLSHLFVLVLIAAFIAAGLWQLGRLGDRQAENTLIESRLDRVVPIATIETTATDIEFTKVAASGVYDGARSILVANRVANGGAGFWTWTVLRLDDGSEILVNRGFLARGIVTGADGAAEFDDATPITGPVELIGLIRRGIGGGSISSDREQVSRPDASLAGAELDVQTRLSPEYYLELQSQEPPTPASFPEPVPPPDLGEGPHRSYAFQWFTFAVLGLIGYALVLLRISRGDMSRGDVPY